MPFLNYCSTWVGFSNDILMFFAIYIYIYILDLKMGNYSIYICSEVIYNNIKRKSAQQCGASV